MTPRVVPTLRGTQRSAIITCVSTVNLQLWKDTTCYLLNRIKMNLFAKCFASQRAHAWLAALALPSAKLQQPCYVLTTMAYQC